MSVSLLLLPVALAIIPIRLVMGKENFDNWVNSLQVKIPSTIENERDLVLTLKRAGYDAEKWGGSIKTHFHGGKQFFFWQLIDGRWTAVFSKADSRDKILQFLHDLETRSRRKLFHFDEETQRVGVLPTRTYPTSFRDSQLLVNALKDLGSNPVQQSNGDIRCDMGVCVLHFHAVPGTAYDVEIENGLNMEQVFQVLAVLDEDYKRLVQGMTYESLRQRIAERDLSIDGEEILEDDSIVITLSINR